MINLSDINSQSFFGKCLRLPLALIPKGFVLRILTGPCRGMKWICGSSVHGCWLGTYEIEKRKAISRWIRPGMTVYDIGSNAGYYSLLFSKSVGLTGQVYAFEALGENVANLLRHLRLNGVKNVTPVQAALSAREGLGSFATARSNSMGRLQNAGGEFTIPTLSIDGLIEKNGFRRPDLVKMDIEGGESAVLEGSKELLKATTAVWFISLHGEKQKAVCRRILAAHRYKILSLDGQDITERLEQINIDEIIAVPS